MSESDHHVILQEFVDHLLPELTAYEGTMYLVLLRHTILNDGQRVTRVGKRTISTRFAKGARGERTNYEHITKVLKGLEKKGCLEIGDTSREGTLYRVIPPREVPAVAEKLALPAPTPEESNYFASEIKRREIFERDNWTCRYCGERVSVDNSTLDHYVPRSRGGDNSKDNLRVACLMCNSIKSGRPFEEAAPHLLESVRERKARGTGSDF